MFAMVFEIVQQLMLTHQCLPALCFHDEYGLFKFDLIGKQ